MGHAEFLAYRKWYVLHHVTALITQLIEARIYIVVEDVSLQQIDYLLSRMNSDRLFNFREQIVHENWQTRNVIHVRVGNDHIADGAALSFGQGNADAAGIHGDAIVDQKAGQPLGRRSVPGGIERAG